MRNETTGSDSQIIEEDEIITSNNHQLNCTDAVLEEVLAVADNNSDDAIIVQKGVDTILNDELTKNVSKKSKISKFISQ